MITFSTAVKLSILAACWVAGSLTTLNPVPVELGQPVSVSAPVFSPEAYDDFDNLIAGAPDCWEDEVVVLVIHDPYGDLDLDNTVGCVPTDNLPVTGYRP